MTTPWDTVSEVIKSVKELAKPGVNLLDLEQRAASTTSLYGATSANQGYQPKWAATPFPGVLCLSVNADIAHGIPRNYKLKEGDLLTIDCGILVDNMAGDAGITIGIGEISDRDRRLIRYTRTATKLGISKIAPGVKITEVGKAIEAYANSRGFKVNKKLFGHGIGQQMHEEPSIPHYDIGLVEKVMLNEKGKKVYSYEEREGTPTFYEGQIVCIEPHFTYKDEFGYTLSDGWTLRTRDGRNSAMLEHMCRVTSNGCEILTNLDEEVS